MVVYFSDGTSQDFSDDSRTVFTVVSGQTLANLESVSSGGTTKKLATTTSSSGVSGIVQVNVSFSSAYQGLVGSIQVNVTKAQDATVTAYAYPSSINSATSTVSTLWQVHCTGVYERASLGLTVVLSDLTKYVVTTSSSTSFSSNSTSVAFVILSSGTTSILVGNSTGLVGVFGRFYGITSSQPWAVTVSSTPAYVVGIQMSSSVFSGQNTFREVSGTSKTLSVKITLADGVVFPNALDSSVTSSWIAAPLWLIFNSSAPFAASINAQGVATLLANYYQMVNLSVSVQQRQSNYLCISSGVVQSLAKHRWKCRCW